MVLLWTLLLRLLGLEAAEAPGTPRAEAKRPQSSPRAKSSAETPASVSLVTPSASNEPDEGPSEPSAPLEASPSRQPVPAALALVIQQPLQEDQQNRIAEARADRTEATVGVSGADNGKGKATADEKVVPNGDVDHAAALQSQTDVEREAHLAQARPLRYIAMTLLKLALV